MRNGPRTGGLAISTVLLLLGLLFSSSAFADAAGKQTDEIGSMGPVPRAECGPSDRVESGLQGQTTSKERASGGSELGYNCNLALVGRFRGEGAFSQDGPSYFDHFVYMATENNPLQAHPGIVVIDVSDPANPQATAYLTDTPAALSPHENNKVNEARGLLGLVQDNGPNFAVYDLNGDCAHPRLASSITVPNSFGHMGGCPTTERRTTLASGFEASAVSCPSSTSPTRTRPSGFSTGRSPVTVGHTTSAPIKTAHVCMPGSRATSALRPTILRSDRTDW
jgi:hypothetical protein